MKTYKVKITETLEKEVEVEAEDRHEAEQIVSDAWHKSEYTPDSLAKTTINPTISIVFTHSHIWFKGSDISEHS